MLRDPSPGMQEPPAESAVSGGCMRGKISLPPQAKDDPGQLAGGICSAERTALENGRLAARWRAGVPPGRYARVTVGVRVLACDLVAVKKQSGSLPKKPVPRAKLYL
jgi:hypothetical protein